MVMAGRHQILKSLLGTSELSTSDDARNVNGSELQYV